MVHAAEVDALNAVVALARDPNSLNSVVEVLPNHGGSETPSTWDPRTLYGWITNPFGILWICLGGFLLLGVAVGLIVVIVVLAVLRILRSA